MQDDILSEDPRVDIQDVKEIFEGSILRIVSSGRIHSYTL
jgi:hypothetical protein